MNVQETSLPGVLLLEPRIFRDARGFSARHASILLAFAAAAEAAAIAAAPAQEARHV